MAAMYYITFILSRRLPPKHYKTSSGGARIEPKSGPCSEQLLRVESRVLEDRAAATYRWERADPDSSIFSSQQQGAGQGDLQRLCLVPKNFPPNSKLSITSPSHQN